MSLFRRRRHEQQHRGDENIALPGRLPWEPREDDLGLLVVDEIGYSLSLDEEWTVRDERGFTWWGKDLAQSVWSEPGFDDNGYEIFRLHARSDLLREFDPTDQNLAVLNALALHATTSGFLVDPDARTVQLAASMYAHAETAQWVKTTFQLVVATQATDAQIKADNAAETVGAEVASTPHPESGARPDYDDMLNLLEHLVVPLGKQPSAWRGEPLERTQRMVQGSPYTILALSGATGFSAEFPFLDRTSLLEVKTTEANPQLGNGVLLVLHLPATIAESEGVRFATELTRTELRTASRSHFLGCWCWLDEGMHYVTFLPNAIHVDDGDLGMIATSMALRAKWAAETFYGDNWEANRDELGRPLAQSPITAAFGFDSEDTPRRHRQ